MAMLATTAFRVNCLSRWGAEPCQVHDWHIEKPSLINQSLSESRQTLPLIQLINGIKRLSKAAHCNDLQTSQRPVFRRIGNRDNGLFKAM